MKFSLLTGLVAAALTLPVAADVRASQSQDSPELDPANKPVELPLGRRADILMARKFYRQAIEVYSEGTGDLASLYARAGLASHRLHELGQAEKYYQDALSVEPNYVEALSNLGVLRYDQGNYNQARDYLQNALRQKSDSAAIQYNLGTVLFREGKFKNATTAYQRALAIDPEIVETPEKSPWMLEVRQPDDKAKFHFLLSEAFRSAGQEEQAERHLSEARQQGFQGTELKDKGRGFFDWLRDLFR